MKTKFRKLKRDSVVSIAKGRELVGVYFSDTNGYDILLECSPKKADNIIKAWNEGGAGHEEHKITVAMYGMQNIALECEDCNEVLSGFDSNIKGVKL